MEPQGKAIPYRTVFSNEPTPVLPATEVVDACLADLHQADSLLWEADHDIFVHDVNADPFLELRQFRMNRWAVKAMLARVYCYKGDEESKAKAYAVASEVVESKLFPLTEALTTENRILFDEHIFSLHIYEMENSSIRMFPVWESAKNCSGSFMIYLPVVLLISVQEMPLFMRC